MPMCVHPKWGRIDHVTQQMEHLASAYFHQDYELDGGSPDGVIGLFVRDEGHADSAELVAEIDLLLASQLTEEQLRQLWVDDWGASYEPDRGMRSWLTSVRLRLADGPT
jgi:hypothetical protein